MTFASIASKPIQSAPDDRIMLHSVKLSKIPVATSLLAIAGLVVLQNLLSMSASHPAELTATQKQVAASQAITSIK